MIKKSTVLGKSSSREIATFASTRFLALECEIYPRFAAIQMAVKPNPVAAILCDDGLIGLSYITSILDKPSFPDRLSVPKRIGSWLFPGHPGTDRLLWKV